MNVDSADPRTTEPSGNSTSEPDPESIHAAVEHAHRDIEEFLAERIAPSPDPDPRALPTFRPGRPWWQFWRR
jgi:hypothetical protein